ncbi:hypothetical protein [Yersinia ruckeri]|nr:hypothetical protein [Yersinia ruckeri]EKN3361808.1 hypothetical protein [Yersinia ruckeri]EKN4184118.1 hypothetical protein [Yersinia ruckeri]EKN4198864.1 hypothetical protein [Yersinia ruckeri]EKN4201332.1 hypothetical protein [Yersinia ruckeri]
MQPSNPQKNAYIERYNQTVRDDSLGVISVFIAG